MSKQVQVSQKVLFALGGFFVASLIVIGFLLGKQSNETPTEQPHLSPSPLAIPLVGQAEQSLDSRLDALDGRVGALRQKAVGQPSSENSSKTALQPPTGDDPQPNDSSSSADLEDRHAYFKQLDAILGSSALASPQPFATRLLEQGMSGDDNGLDAVLDRTNQAVSDVKAVEPPPTCREHKELVLAQLSQAITLLKEVQTAKRAGETRKLKTLPLPDDKIMGETLKLQKLDRSLRP